MLIRYADQFLLVNETINDIFLYTYDSTVSNLIIEDFIDFIMYNIHNKIIDKISSI
jgi:hypothetical protein